MVHAFWQTATPAGWRRRTRPLIAPPPLASGHDNLPHPGRAGRSYAARLRTRARARTGVRHAEVMAKSHLPGDRKGCVELPDPARRAYQETKKPRNAGLSRMRRRGLEPPPGYPGPGPQPGNPGVISVQCVQIVQNVRGSGHIGRNGRSGCCRGCCHAPDWGPGVRRFKSCLPDSGSPAFGGVLVVANSLGRRHGAATGANPSRKRPLGVPHESRLRLRDWQRPGSGVDRSALLCAHHLGRQRRGRSGYVQIAPARSRSRLKVSLPDSQKPDGLLNVMTAFNSPHNPRPSRADHLDLSRAPTRTGERESPPGAARTSARPPCSARPVAS